MAGALLRAAGSSRMRASAIFASRSCSATRKRCASLQTTTGGAKPINGYFKAKARLDAAMRAELGRPPAPWVNHDIRRTVRTRLPELRVPEPVAERVIGHAAKGLARVYDQHRYASEMREALDAWEKRLIALVTPPPDNGARPPAEQRFSGS